MRVVLCRRQNGATSEVTLKIEKMIFDAKWVHATEKCFNMFLLQFGDLFRKKEQIATL